MSRSSRFLVAAALVLGVEASSFAQQATQPRPPQPNQPRVQPGQPAQPGQPGLQPGQANQRTESRADAQLAACLVVDNQNEVALAKLAQEHGQSQQVKRFAEQLIEDHGQLLTKLQRFAGPGQPGEGRGQRRTEGAERRDPAQPNQENQPADRATADRPAAADQPRDPGTPRAGGVQRGGQLDFVAIKREIGQQCLQSARKELQAKEGAEFDMCFMGMQIMGHMHALDTMKVFKQHASPELAQTLDEGIRTATAHLEHAKEIGKQLHNQAVSTARRQTDN